MRRASRSTAKLETVADEPKNGLAQQDRLAIRRRQPLHGRGHRVMSDSRSRYHLDQRNDVRRVPEVRDQEAARPTQMLAERFRHDAASAARKDCGFREDTLKSEVERLPRVHRFDYRLYGQCGFTEFGDR